MTEESSPSPDLLARMASRGLEDARTELLAELLRHSLVRRTFLRDVLKLTLSNAEACSLAVETQVRNTRAGGTPDLVLEGPRVKIVVENKIDALLTVNQPNEYVKELARWLVEHPDGIAMLGVQGPHARVGHLANACWHRLSVDRGGSTFAQVGSIGIRVFSWQETRDVFERVELDQPDWDFLRLAWLALIPARPIVLGPMERRHLQLLMSPAALEADLLMEDLMRDLPVSLVKHGVAVGRQTIGSDHSWRGFDCRGESGSELWIGVWTRATLQFEHSRLWCQVYARAFGGMGKQHLDRANIRSFAASSVPGGSARGSLVPLEILTGLEHEEQVEQLAQQILRVRRTAAGQSVDA